MTQPVVTPTGLELYGHCAPVAKQDADNKWLLLLLCDALVGAGLDPVLQLSRDSDAGDGWSALLDLDRCPDRALPWLGQFVGVPTLTGGTGAQDRDLILNRPGWKRGRPATIISAVKQTLTGSQHVNFLERDTSPYHATIQVFISQMPDEAATLAAIAANKPSMLIIDLDELTGPTYADTLVPLPPGPDYADRQAEFPTYGDIQVFT